MLPYLHVPKLTHYVLLAVAVLLGHGLQRYRAARLGLHDVAAGNLSLLLVLGAAYGAHWVALAASGKLFTTHPALVLLPYAGGVSLGGLGGGFLAAWAYARWKRLPLGPHLAAGAWAFAPAWAVLRTGCYLAHDSLGRPGGGWLSVATPDGPRHDLAVYEIVWAIGFEIAIWRWPTHPVPKLLLSYGLLRAAIAPLRVDPSALDAAGAAILILAGMFSFFRRDTFNPTPTTG